ncbi:MAG: acyl-CoA dehydrogenase family protein [Chloroflexi bacterium]|uniref:acyl-CoA dehydrogenase family protein n=1 Tax=Candidatus Flexifilum breve TaxID=3140694 RepID=UPI003134EC84|nr:acyl-CoA dehydrogenase family protein [Chloroflexota bacterium]
MRADVLLSPTNFLEHGLKTELPYLRELETFWEAEGRTISTAVDQAGTPWLKQFDRFGQRIDQIDYPPDYWRLLRRGYTAGAIWRGYENKFAESFLIGYLTSYYDPGLYCPYTVSFSTAAVIDKYAAPDIRERFLPPMLRHDDTVWQGATWMTEARGGSDLGATVETVARPNGEAWTLTGDKYFCSNAGAEVAVVAARSEGAPAGVRGLGLFVVPRLRADGSLNYHVRRLKDKIATRSVPTGEIELRDSEAYLLGEPGQGIYHIMEVLNLSRVCNNMGSVALMQRALAEALIFAQGREIFGKKLADQPLMRKQIEDRVEALRIAFCLAWESACMAAEVWREPAPQYSNRFHLFRLITHLAKYWTAEQAVQTAKWAMEVNGGMGTLAEFGVERLLREAMILNIWEGPPHRQILDGIEVMERKGAHKLLFDHLAPYDEDECEPLQSRVDLFLTLGQEEKETFAEELFRDVAALAGKALKQKYVG